MRGVALILAAGAGSRLGTGPKALVELGGESIVARAVRIARRASLVDSVIVAAPAGVRLADCTVVEGGSTRQESAFRAFSAVSGAAAVVVHDAARVLCPSELFDACLSTLDVAEGAVACIPVGNTLKQVEGDYLVDTVDRSKLWEAQTPQAFRSEVYRRAHEEALADGLVATDDSSLVERLGVKVRVVLGTSLNFKITTQDDLILAEAYLR